MRAFSCAATRRNAGTIPGLSILGPFPLFSLPFQSEPMIMTLGGAMR